MSFTGLLNSLCDIQSKAETQTGSGQLSQSWSVRLAGVMCRANVDRTAGENPALGQHATKNARFYFTIDTSISEADRIVFKGETWEVVAVTSDSSGDHLEVQAVVRYNR